MTTLLFIAFMITALSVIIAFISIQYGQDLKGRNEVLEHEYNVLKDNYNNLKIILDKEREYNALKTQVNTDNADTLVNSSADILSALATRTRKNKS